MVVIKAPHSIELSNQLAFSFFIVANSRRFRTPFIEEVAALHGGSH